MSNNPSLSAPPNPDISRSNYVELISLDIDTQYSVCTNPSRSVHSSIPILLTNNKYNACDPVEIINPPIDKEITNVNKVQGMLNSVAINKMMMFGASDLLGNDLAQEYGQLPVTGQNQAAARCQPFCTTPIACSLINPTAVVDVHFIDAGTTVSGLGPGRTLLQLFDALSNNYDYRMAISSVRSSLQPSITIPNDPIYQYYKMNLKTLKGFWNNGCTEPKKTVDYYASSLYNRVNVAAISGRGLPQYKYYGVGAEVPGNLAGLAVTSIIRSNGFDLDLNVFPVTTSGAGANSFYNDRVEIAQNLTDKNTYKVLTNSAPKIDLSSSDSFLDTQFNPLKIVSSDTVRFREGANKILCIYVDSQTADVSLNENGYVVNQSFKDTVNEAVSCGYKIIIIAANTIADTSLFYYQLELNIGDQYVAILPVDRDTINTGVFSDRIKSAINKLCGLTVDSTPSIAKFGMIKEVWQSTSVLGSDPSKKLLTYFDINNDTTGLIEKDRTPLILKEHDGLSCYDVAFDRLFYIKLETNGSYNLSMLDLKTNVTSVIIQLPFLQATNIGIDAHEISNRWRLTNPDGSTNETETNIPTAICYDPATRFVFIGTDSGHLYVVSINRKSFSEIIVSNVKVINRSQRAYPTISALAVGYVPSSNIPDTRLPKTANRAIFVGMNVAATNISGKTKTTLLRAYDYNDYIVKQAGFLANIQLPSLNDIYIPSMANPRSFCFVQSPSFAFKTIPGSNKVNIEDQKLPGLMVCYNEWNSNQTNVFDEDTRAAIINPMIFANTFSAFTDFLNTLSTFPITVLQPFQPLGADYITADSLGQFIIMARIEAGTPQRSISFYHINIPSEGFPAWSAFTPAVIKLNEYKIGALPDSIFIRSSIRCAETLKLIERTTFSTSLNGWNYDGSSINYKDALIDGELLLKPGESISKDYENVAGTYYLTITTSDYRIDAYDSDQNITGLINIVTTKGTRLHYLPTKPIFGLISEGETTKLIQSEYNPTLITTAGTATYLIDLPASFNITITNSMSDEQFTGINNPLLKYNPLGAGIIDFRLCRLVNDAFVNNGVKNLRFNLRFRGIPRSEINFFSAFVKVVMRNTKDPAVKQTIYRLPSADGRNLSDVVVKTVPSCEVNSTCNYWKQNGNGGVATQSVLNQITYKPSEFAAIDEGIIQSIANIGNCVWCIPSGNAFVNPATGQLQNAVNPDVYTLYFGDFSDDGMVVESIDYYLLVNRINDLNGVAPSCPKITAYCGPDPVDNLEVSMLYYNCRDESKSFTNEIPINTLYFQNAELSRVLPTNLWDYIRTNANGTSAGPPLGNAYKGLKAQWIKNSFLLDNAAGTGIDQCTEPSPNNLNYNGTTITKETPNGLTLIVPKLSNFGSAAHKCDPTFVIEDISDTNATNEIQQLNIPTAGGGSFDLIFAKLGDKQQVTVPYNATADSLKNLLESLSNVGAGNVATTQEDTNITVEFINNLSATALPLMNAKSRNLVGTFYAFTSRLSAGSKNERQTITNTAASYRSFVLTYNGETTTTLPFDASLNTVRSALEALPSIGIGNVVVTGAILNGDANYRGPWSIDFVGTLAGQNVSRLTPSNADYSVITNWVGGIGINEKQSFKYKANAGNFKLTVYGLGTNVGTTEPIPYNAPVNVVKSSILAACDFYNDGDLILSSKITGNEYEWTIEYVGAYTSQSIKILTIESVDLVGDSVTITRLQAGGGKPKKIQWTYTDTLGGYYVLKFELVNGSTYFTDHIQYDADATAIEKVLNSTTLFAPGDVAVTQRDTGKKGTYEYVMVVRKNLPSLKMTAIFKNTLLCDPIGFIEVNSPPYEYDPLKCPTQAPKIHGVDGLVCKPFPPEPPADPPEPCCTYEKIPDNINKSIFMKIERDLFDPYMMFDGKIGTVGKLMASRNYAKSKFKPYYLSNTGTCVSLTEADYDDELKTRTTLVIMTQEVIDRVPKIKIVERIRNNQINKPFCGALPSQRGQYNKKYPDIMPGKNYDI